MSWVGTVRPMCGIYTCLWWQFGARSPDGFQVNFNTRSDASCAYVNFVQCLISIVTGLGYTICGQTFWWLPFQLWYKLRPLNRWICWVQVLHYDAALFKFSSSPLQSLHVLGTHCQVPHVEFTHAYDDNLVPDPLMASKATSIHVLRHLEHMSSLFRAWYYLSTILGCTICGQTSCWLSYQL